MKDLFEHYTELPRRILKAVEDLDADLNSGQDAYAVLKAHRKKFNQLGYDFEYYLDAAPYNLHKIAN